MQAYPKALEEEEWIIWNASLGLRDFVMIGHIDLDQNVAWLEEPYAMVGPFSLEELTAEGLISFAECVVMSKQKWREDREKLLQDSMIRRRRAQQEFFDELERRQRRRRNQRTNIQQEHRTLLNLPPEGVLEFSQIKSAYRKAAKKAHPDAGGSQELFIRIKEACDALLESV